MTTILGILLIVVILAVTLWKARQPARYEKRRAREEALDLKLKATIDRTWRTLDEGNRLIYDGEMPKVVADPKVIAKRAELRAMGRPEELIDAWYPLPKFGVPPT